MTDKPKRQNMTVIVPRVIKSNEVQENDPK